ncbi:MAG: hypothetical protein NC390_08460 [Fusobacterium sp.]|nr:hypothetical protein [Fusobacterium sp.]
MLKKLSKKNVNKSNVVPKSFATNPIASQNALELFARQTDIKKFTNLVMQGEISDEFLDLTQAELLMKDIFNPFDEKSYKRLAENEKLLNDLTTDMD